MSDQELLEKAARAAGNGATWSDELGAMHWPGIESMGVWNPLCDDGDNFRLVHHCHLDIHRGEDELGDPIITVVPSVGRFCDAPWCYEYDIAYFRRAVVKAAGMCEGE